MCYINDDDDDVTGQGSKATQQEIFHELEAQ